MDGRKFLGVQRPFVGSAHQVHTVGVQEQFKIQLDTRHQTFTRLEGWQMGSNDEGVPMLFQQPVRQRSQFFIATPIRGCGTSALAPVAPMTGITLS